MTDVLALTILLDDGKYASENNKYQHGLAWGNKSAIYRKVEREVKASAEREILRTGWTTAQCECLLSVTRIVPRQWRVDAVNLGTPEANALTKAGVWADDRYAQPSLLWVRHDRGGQHRVVIVVQKLYAPANTYREPAEEERPAMVPRSDRARAVGAWRPGQPVPDGFAVENGRVLVPIADAIQRMR